METANPKTILTCAQPTSQLQLGNYLGAVQQWVKFQNDHHRFFGIVDLHAMTIFQEPAQLRKNTLSLAAQYIACGLNPEKCHLFIQSHITGHTELAWILGCITSIGQLERMTQFKDKAQAQSSAKGFIGAGLLYYPILQASDILLYNAHEVPVGEDQRQHLELTRDLAERFNHLYSPTFNIPEPVINPSASKIMSLQDPTKKMSKSDPNPNGVIFILDEPAVIRKKIMSSVTDNGTDICLHPEKPGISNLLTILHIITQTPIKSLEQTFQGFGYGAFKERVADAVIKELSPVQKRYHELINQKTILEDSLSKGQKMAQLQANKTLAKVYKKIGLLPRF
jgi:tryptophanyl-tRNA synthetase